MNTHIIPAIMPNNFEDIEHDVAIVKKYVDFVQLDLMDGNYVSEKTWPFHYGTDYDLEDLKKETTSFPYWEDINYELDLMIARPEETLDTWLSIGAARIIFHYASVHDWEKIRNIEIGVRNFVKIGIAITIHDNIDDVCKLIDEGIFDFIQIMGIDQIGYQGEPFEESSLGYIKKLHNRYPDMIISIDGAVSLDTISLLHHAGATRFVSGSAVYGNGMVDENIELLLQEIE
jgi:ribulose-phosphate 3-epimerase